MCWFTSISCRSGGSASAPAPGRLREKSWRSTTTAATWCSASCPRRRPSAQGERQGEQAGEGGLEQEAVPGHLGEPHPVRVAGKGGEGQRERSERRQQDRQPA